MKKSITEQPNPNPQIALNDTALEVAQMQFRGFQLRRRSLHAAFAAALTSLAGLAQAQSRGSPRLGSAIELPPLPLLGGGNWDSDQSREKVLVLYWWASWCPACARQTPEMQVLHEAKRGTDLQVLGVAVDKDRVAAQNHLLQKGFSFPSAWASSESLAQMPWTPKGVPAVWVYNRAQKLVHTKEGWTADAVQKLTQWL